MWAERLLMTPPPESDYGASSLSPHLAPSSATVKEAKVPILPSARRGSEVGDYAESDVVARRVDTGEAREIDEGAGGASGASGGCGVAPRSLSADSDKTDGPVKAPFGSQILYWIAYLLKRFHAFLRFVICARREPSNVWELEWIPTKYATDLAAYGRGGAFGQGGSGFANDRSTRRRPSMDYKRRWRSGVFALVYACAYRRRRRQSRDNIAHANESVGDDCEEQGQGLAPTPEGFNSGHQMTFRGAATVDPFRGEEGYQAKSGLGAEEYREEDRVDDELIGGDWTNSSSFSYCEKSSTAFAMRLTPRNAARQSNRMNHQKYSLLSFLPKALYYQFRYFLNFFYLIIGLSQLAPVFRVGPVFTFFAPLSLVLTLSLLKEALDDYRRFKRDAQLNDRLFDVLHEDGAFRPRTSASLRTGQVIRLHSNDAVPADCVFLATNSPDGLAFLRTDNLDGETDLKLRRAVNFTQRLHMKPLETLKPRKSLKGLENGDKDPDCRGNYEEKTENSDPKRVCTRLGHVLARDVNFSKHKFRLKYEAPNARIDEWNATLNVIDENGAVVTESLTLENTLWSSCSVAAGPVLAMILHCGPQAKSALEGSVPARQKIGHFDQALNRIAQLLCLVLSITSLLLTAAKDRGALAILYLIRFVVLLSSIVPISLRVSMDIAKIAHCHFIKTDRTLNDRSSDDDRNLNIAALAKATNFPNLTKSSKSTESTKSTRSSAKVEEDLPDMLPRNSSLAEELGLVDLLFTDKTGTLTKNIMCLKYLTLGSNSLRYAANAPELIYAARQLFQEAPSSRSLLPGALASSSSRDSLRRRVPIKRLENMTEVARLLFALAVTHSVNTCVQEDGEVGFQAASPDELASVEFMARNLGVVFTDRSLTSLTLVDTYTNCESRVNIVRVFPFTSQLKRMGILISLPSGTDTDDEVRFHFLCKGADESLTPMLRLVPQSYLESLDLLSRTGLRTLVFGSRHLSSSEVRQFLDAYSQAENCFVDRKARCESLVAQMLERNLDLVGVSAVEDELQRHVPETVEAILQAGIKIWLLTGDRLDTAVRIASGAGLRSPRQPMIVIRGPTPGLHISHNPPTSDTPRASNRPTHGRFTHGQIGDDKIIFRTAEDIYQFLLLKLNVVDPSYLPVDSPGYRRTGGTHLYDRDGGEAFDDRYVSPLERGGSMKSFQHLRDTGASRVSRPSLAAYLHSGGGDQNAFGFGFGQNIKRGVRKVTGGFGFGRGEGVGVDVGGVGRSFSIEGTNAKPSVCFDGAAAGLVLETRDGALLRRIFHLLLEHTDVVLFCRCAPSQKALLVNTARLVFGDDVVVAAVGDGENDVPMIKAANVGIGVVGVEGRQAALASDFSISEFCCLKRLLLWHGRMAYMRSAKAASFVIHRGLLISSIQTIFTSLYFYAPLALFQGWLQIGYSTYYTMLPGLALLLDYDIPPSLLSLFPELYQSHKNSFNSALFFEILFKAVFQGSAIMLAVIIFFEDQLSHLISIVFSAIVFAELLNVCGALHTINLTAILCLATTLAIYLVSIPLLPSYFDVNLITSKYFWVTTAGYTVAAWLPFFAYDRLQSIRNPPQHVKLTRALP